MVGLDGKRADRLPNTVKRTVWPDGLAGRRPLIRRKDLKEGRRTDANLPERMKIAVVIGGRLVYTVVAAWRLIQDVAEK